MKNKIRFYLVVFALFLFSFGYLKKDEINYEDIRSTLKVFGVFFSKQDINTMKDYVNRNKNSYNLMREKELGINVAPALSFNIDLQKSKNIRFSFDDIITELPDNKKDIAFLSVGELSYLLKHGKISSLELTKIYLERIQKYDATLNSVITLTEDLAIKQAIKADEEISRGVYRGPLHGIPYGIKDLASFPGHPTTWGAMPYKDQLINEKAKVILKLEEAGAVMLGKLSSGALARGDVWFGGKTKNPWDVQEGSSGSSAGSASAVSAGLVGFAIGTETLGSIVSPSTRCGVIGLRPSFGSISTSGFMTLSWSMDKVGPICRTPRDCAIVYSLIKENNKDEVSVVAFDHLAEELKIGYTKKLFDKDTSRFYTNNAKTIELLSQSYKMNEVDLPNNYPFSVFDIILRAEAGAFFDSFLRKRLDSSMVEQGERSRANSLRQSRLIPAVEYIQANRHRQELIEETKSLFEKYDVILSPTFGENQLLITNLTGHPVVSLPNGLDKKGKPTSITIIGNYGSEDKILYFAEKLKNMVGFDKKPPLFY